MRNERDHSINDKVESSAFISVTTHFPDSFNKGSIKKIYIVMNSGRQPRSMFVIRLSYFLTVTDESILLIKALSLCVLKNKN